MDPEEKKANILAVVERRQRGPLPLSDDGMMTVERIGTRVLVRNHRKRAKLSMTRGGQVS
jgi:hypothetical protein